ncbi:hypothetical protein BS78_09G249300 [Paspalum vaginatum]|nr:hypothetical protein BS78_09G249300 [Paspalum vaginatum]
MPSSWAGGDESPMMRVHVRRTVLTPATTAAAAPPPWPMQPRRTRLRDLSGLPSPPPQPAVPEPPISGSIAEPGPEARVAAHSHRILDLFSLVVHIPVFMDLACLREVVAGFNNIISFFCVCIYVHSLRCCYLRLVDIFLRWRI